MNVQTIKAADGQEFVLLPIGCYEKLKPQIEEYFDTENDDEYVPFVLEHFVKNPIALARARAGLTQKELADLMGCAQSNISQLETGDSVTADALIRVKEAIEKNMLVRQQSGN